MFIFGCVYVFTSILFLYIINIILKLSTCVIEFERVKVRRTKCWLKNKDFICNRGIQEINNLVIVNGEIPSFEIF